MKLNRTEDRITPSYPGRGGVSPGLVCSLALGASITMSMALGACGKPAAREAEPTVPRDDGAHGAVTTPPPRTQPPSPDTRTQNKGPAPLPGQPAVVAAKPDADGDGVPDDVDRCPKVKGHKRYQGCTYPIKKMGIMVRPRHP